MYLGTRSIRSAGRTSGSIEITLPTQLQVLEGVACRLTVRDGPRPEIVLQPELSAAQALFQAWWQKLRLGLGEAGELGDFSLADFNLVLFAPAHWQERPPLAYADALTVLAHEPAPEALARLLVFLAVAAGRRLGLEGALALAFGDAVAYLMTGTTPGLGTDFERGMAHRLFWGAGRAAQPVSQPGGDRAWQQARPGLRRVYDQFYVWQQDPPAYAAARAQWYRAFSVETGMRAAPAANYPDRSW